MMTRRKLPWRHPITTIDVPHSYPGSDIKKLCISYAKYEDTGEYAELWLNGINGTEKLMNYDMRDTAVQTSIGFQHGETPEKVWRSFSRDKRGKAIGWLGTAIDALRREPADA